MVRIGERRLIQKTVGQGPVAAGNRLMGLFNVARDFGPALLGGFLGAAVGFFLLPLPQRHFLLPALFLNVLVVLVSEQSGA